MSTRGSLRLRASSARARLARCPRCLLHEPACLCAEVEPIELATRVLVLRHSREVHKPTNTGRLVALALANGEVRTIGGRGDAFDAAGLDDPARRAVLLYPSDDAATLARDEHDARPVTLVVPDADWRRAHKLCARQPALAALPRVLLPPGPPSAYRLRHHPDPRFVATFEAVARALGVLEGEAVRERLERVLALLVERTLRARGRSPAGGAGQRAGAGRCAPNQATSLWCQLPTAPAPLARPSRHQA